MKSRLTAGGAALAALLLGATLAVGTATAAPAADGTASASASSSAGPRAASCEGKMRGQKTVWMKYDEFQEGRGVTYLKHCQALRLYDGAGEEVECQTPDLDTSVIDLYDVQVEYQVWRSMGKPGVVTLTCTEAGSGEEFSKVIQIITRHQPPA